MNQKVVPRRIYTKEKQLAFNYRLSRKDRELMLAAAHSLGCSRAEFLRNACREKAMRVLGHQN
jgi:uncharacterized protein (DUF1778 family)